MSGWLDLEEVTGGYGSSQVLFGVSFSVDPGEVVTLMGRNGMGKTTTVRSIHGDLGMFTKEDVVIALSNSGESNEVVTILPLLKRKGVTLISITSKPKSALASSADVSLVTPIEREACPLNLAPTSSTTAQLVLGDAIATALLEARGFSAEDFAFSHPGGALGRRLLLKVSDLMHSGDEVPYVSPNTPIQEALPKQLESLHHKFHHLMD